MEKTLNPAPPLANLFSKISTTEIGTTEKELHFHARKLTDLPLWYLSLWWIFAQQSRDRYPGVCLRPNLKHNKSCQCCSIRSKHLPIESKAISPYRPGRYIGYIHCCRLLMNYHQIGLSDSHFVQYENRSLRQVILQSTNT